MERIIIGDDGGTINWSLSGPANVSCSWKSLNSLLHHICERIDHDLQLQKGEGKIVMYFSKKITYFFKEICRSCTSSKDHMFILREK